MGRIILGFALILGLSACGDPLQKVARLSDVEVAADATTAGVSASPTANRTREGGLFGRLLDRQDDDPTDAAVEAALAEAQGIGAPSDETDGSLELASAETSETVSEDSRSGGLFGVFRRNRLSTSAAPQASASASAADPDAAVAQVVEASASAQAIPEPEIADEPRRAGFGIFRRGQNAPEVIDGPDAQIVEAGTVLPFGEIARVCDLPSNRRGQRIATVSGYDVYDTIPNSNAARPYYLTGFRDDCARTFTAAVVIPSDIETHEFVRYQPSNERFAYNGADNAYEAIKASTCRVGRGQPCGERSARLARDTHFLSVYSNFGGANPVWAEILLHGGRVAAMDVKEGG